MYQLEVNVKLKQKRMMKQFDKEKKEGWLIDKREVYRKLEDKWDGLSL